MRDLLARLDGLRERLREIPQADERRLQDLRTEILGRKSGTLTDIIRSLPSLDPDSRKAVGGPANTLKREWEAALDARAAELEHAGAAVSDIDPTMPGRSQWHGGLHLVTQVVDEICGIFRELGFTRAVGPEIETERNNFYALNFPKDHPLSALYLRGINMLLKHGVRSCLEYARSGDAAKARELSNPDLAPHVSFVDMGGHGYAVVRAASDSLETEFVGIPRPLERSERADGGPLNYRVRSSAKLWAKGESPKLKLDVLEGDPKLSI